MIGDTKCSDGCGLDIQNSMRSVLTSIEADMRADMGINYQLSLTCGARCEKHNAEVGGVKNSAHTLGLAADIALASSQERYLFLKSVYNKNIKRIEDRLLNHGYMHIDIATGAVPHPDDSLQEYPQDVFIVLP